MNIRVVTASAGSGKTWRLANELEDALASGRARPSSIVATTFTTDAAAELIERARTRLLRSNRAQDAHELLASRIGTVNAVCGQLVCEFAFELGLSPDLRVLDEAQAIVELRRALDAVVGAERAGELVRFKAIFDPQLEWQADVQRIVETARANGLGPGELAVCARRSVQELEACLGSATEIDLDRALVDAMKTAIAAIAATGDQTAGTRRYVESMSSCTHALEGGRFPAWGSWASLARGPTTQKSLAYTITVQRIAERHAEHPRLRADLARLITLMFEVASDALGAYQEHKRATGAIDFVDQEALALELLRRADVQEALRGQLDLVLVDEFQDTSPIQLAVFLELARLANESIWVGDPKQAIFAFRGTDPALMDAAIESLSTGTLDPDLVAAAVGAVARPTDTLDVSYRSRPALVALTSEIFARAFVSQGIPEERTRLSPALKVEPAGLGPIVELWPLDPEPGKRSDTEASRAQAVAAGVRDLLARAPMVRAGEQLTPARARDVAVLCRTNKQCQEVADALAGLGVPAVVPRMHLLDTLEARVVLAGLALWVDPHDALAAAELARMLSYPTDLGAFVENVLGAPGRDAFASEPSVVRILAARDVERDLGPVAAVDAVIAATDLRRLCAEWGDTPQRLGNLDAFRAHAVHYATKAALDHHAATIVGLLRHLEALVPRFGGWGAKRTDRQALLAGEDAVTISTWHRAKGLEWPITVLFGLESLKQPTSWGVHVMSDRTTFDLANPLAGRWIRYWPNPYKSATQQGAVRTAYESTPTHAAIVARARREALRVLYVGWTRARDRLVLAGKRGHLLDGILSTLRELDPSLIDEPRVTAAGDTHLTWAGIEVSAHIAPSHPQPRIIPARVPGTITLGRSPAPTPIPRARIAPSSAEPVPCTLGELVTLGPRIAITGSPNMEAVGDAIHRILAADRVELAHAARVASARDLLAAYQVAGHLDAEDVLAAVTRFWAWIEQRFSNARIHREWPIAHRTDAGTIVTGTADLVIAHASGFAVIDHKSFPGRSDAAADRAIRYSGQLAAYAAAIRAATNTPVTSTWIHFPVRGELVEVRLGDSNKRGAA